MKPQFTSGRPAQRVCFALVLWMSLILLSSVSICFAGGFPETVSCADDVIALQGKGVATERIVEIIRQSPRVRKPSPEDIEKLKSAGISEPILLALEEKSLAGGNQEPQVTLPKSYSGDAVSSFQTFHVKGDPGNFREDATLKKGFGLDAFRMDWRGPRFLFTHVDGLFDAENEARVTASINRLEDFSIRIEYKKYVKYDDQSSSNFAPNVPGFLGTRPEFVSLPGDTTLSRSSASVAAAFNLFHRIRLTSGYEFRSRQGNILQLLGGSFTNAVDFSVPTRRAVDSESHTVYLGSEFSIGLFNFTVKGSFETLDDREHFLRPNFNGFIFNRDLLYNERQNSTFMNVSVVADAQPAESLYLSFGYVHNRFASTPAWERLNFDRNFVDTRRIGEGLRAKLRGNVLFVNLSYIPHPLVSVSYQMRQEWEQFDGRGRQTRFENPAGGPATERLLSETGEEATAHRERVLFTFAPKKAVFKVSYNYERRSKDFDYLFTPSGIDFLDGASIQNGTEILNDHRFNFDFKYKQSRDTQLFAQFEHRERDYDENFAVLVRQYFLGDRHFKTDTLTLGAKHRVSRYLDLVSRYSQQRRYYEVFTTLPQASKNTFDSDTVSLAVNAHPSQRVFLFGLVNYTKVENHLAGLTKAVDFRQFAPFVYLQSNTTYIAGTSFLPSAKWRLSVEYRQSGSAGTVQNLLRAATTSTEYSLSERLTLGAKYQYFGFGERHSSFDNYNVNLFQAGLKVTF